MSKLVLRLGCQLKYLPLSGISSTKNEHPHCQAMLLLCWCFSLHLSEYKMSMQEKQTSRDHITDIRCLKS